MYKVKMAYQTYRIDETFIERIRLEDERTVEINVDIIIDLVNYIETPRIRKNLPEAFVNIMESLINEWIEAVEDMVNQGQVLKEIYELLYVNFPDVKRKFKECMRRRNKRLNSKGQTKWEVRRIIIARRKGAKTRKSNKAINEEKYRSSLNHKINDLMSKSWNQ